MTGSYFVQTLDGWNLDADAMVVREGKQNIPFSLHEYSEIPSGALLGMSNGPMLPTTLENAGLRDASWLESGRGCNGCERGEAKYPLLFA